MKPYLSFLFCLILTSCITNKKTPNPDSNHHSYQVKSDSLPLFDKSRNRLVPIAIYSPKTEPNKVIQKVVIFSHGYSENRLGANKAYSYLTEELASKGYYVVSIQHELPTDELIPTKGIPQIVRRPFWERGCENILFVINELKKTKPELDYQHLVLIGHSNGGDMSALFAHQYPQLVDKIISLDNRRMQLPRTKHPKVYSLRSSDQIADEGVLPTLEEQKKFNMKMIKLPNTIHNDMNDNGTEEQKKEINNYIIGFLSN